LSYSSSAFNFAFSEKQSLDLGNQLIDQSEQLLTTQLFRINAKFHVGWQYITITGFDNVEPLNNFGGKYAIHIKKQTQICQGRGSPTWNSDPPYITGTVCQRSRRTRGVVCK